MRILGDGPFSGQNDAVRRARKWIHDHGGVVAIPSWGKTWLSVDITNLLYFNTLLDIMVFKNLIYRYIFYLVLINVAAPIKH